MQDPLDLFKHPGVLKAAVYLYMCAYIYICIHQFYI